MVDPTPYVTDFERIRRHLRRYITSKRFGETPDREYSLPWLEDAEKNKYSPKVQIHNWVEERCDINYIKNQPPPKINQFGYAYKSEYQCRFGDRLGGKIIPKRRSGCVYPGHQPELGPPLPKELNPYHSETRASFQHPATVTTATRRKK